LRWIFVHLPVSADAAPKAGDQMDQLVFDVTEIA
jgi:hypothetical protein